MDLQLNGMYGHSLVVIGRALIEIGEIQERERYELRSISRQQPPETLAQGAALIGAAIQGAVQIQADVAEQPAADDAPKAKRTRKSPPADAAPADEAAPAAVPAPAPEEPQVTLVDLRAKLAELSRDGKADKVKALLADFGVTKLTELDSAKFAAVMTAAEAI